MNSCYDYHPPTEASFKQPRYLDEVWHYAQLVPGFGESMIEEVEFDYGQLHQFLASVIPLTSEEVSKDLVGHEQQLVICSRCDFTTRLPFATEMAILRQVFLVSSNHGLEQWSSGRISSRIKMDMPIWNKLESVSICDRSRLLLNSSIVHSCLRDACDQAHAALEQDGLPPCRLLDAEGASLHLAVVLAPSTVACPAKKSGDLVTQRTGQCSSWRTLAGDSTFAQHWEVTIERSEIARLRSGLSWMAEFVLEASCRGWYFQQQAPDEQGRETVVFPLPDPTVVRPVRDWLVSEYDSVVQAQLASGYTTKPWYDYNSPVEASLDFWGFYIAARWSPGAVTRAQYLGQASLRTFLHEQVRAFASEKLRQWQQAGKDVDGPPIMAPSPESLYLEVFRECVEKHRDQFGPEVKAWVDLMLSQYVVREVPFAETIKGVTPERRHATATAYDRRNQFNNAMKKCVNQTLDGPTLQPPLSPDGAPLKFAGTLEKGARP